jgi:hypothetical protein
MRKSFLLLFFKKEVLSRKKEPKNFPAYQPSDTASAA